MISVDFSLAIALYLGGCLVAVFLFWLISRKRKDKELSLQSRYIWFCSICSYTYVNTREDRISLCPRCGSYNKK